MAEAGPSLDRTLEPNHASAVTMIKVLLIDDNETFLKYAARYVGREVDLEVVGTAQSGEAGVRQASVLGPDVVLLDQVMPGGSGVDVVEHLKRVAPGCRIIMLTMHEASSYRERAFRCGADGYVTKERMLEDLLPEIRRLVP